MGTSEITRYRPSFTRTQGESPFRRTYPPPRRTSLPRAQGFSIIELMVGLVIGLLTLLAIYQLFAVSEGRRRTVAAVSQAQSAGALALFAIEREIRSAGLGFASLDTTFLGCKVKATNTARSPAEFEFPFQPVEIKDGKEIWVLTGSSSNMFVGARFTGSQSGEFKMEKSNAGFQAGDVMVGTKDTNTTDCLMMAVNTSPTPLLTTIITQSLILVSLVPTHTSTAWKQELDFHI